ncbi:uncharacterized protein LOC105233194 [Bactrocera dorsalis]|uniref:Uncharacterized protein LOC105233194 n=1 Tax=Bactrocera dorsalis TaxID=27457 RepID=A0A6I9W8U7_BACDO|nr:uncharacterized protein LOC105233194 [Bactrocera dorsalis]
MSVNIVMLLKGESAGLCCTSGKISLPSLSPPPEPLKTLLAGNTSQSKLFLRKIRKFNSCFQMTSFGATKIVHNKDGCNFESTFKIQGQIGSLLPMPDADPKFLQIYFIGDEENQANTRCAYNRIEQIEEREIVEILETFLQSNNQLVRLFKSLSNRLQNGNCVINIKADKVPNREHAGTYNVPTVNEVAVVIAGDPTEHRDIRIQRRDNTVQTIQDNHRSYDALQYPLIFWEGEDGYHLNIKQRNPTTGEVLTKKVSAMNFYAYRLMIRAIGNVDGTNNINNIGTTYILSSSYTGSPRHMQEYIQDAMTYVRTYGRPDLFITFTCNRNWDEIKNLLLPDQSSMHRHDIIARVFKQKLKSLINLVTHHSVFGETRCWLYSVEWQKRGLPHAHILIWLVDKVRPEEIDHIISAEIPDPNVDQELFDIVTTNMIHGPCGTLNIMSLCVDNGKCTKRFPKPCTADTITNIDGYPSYRRRDVDNGGQSYE